MKIKDRAINKIRSKIAWLELDYARIEKEVRSISVTEDLIQISLDYNRREINTYKYILKHIKV